VFGYFFYRKYFFCTSFIFYTRSFSPTVCMLGYARVFGSIENIFSVHYLFFL